jgi:hypothetical protein
MIWPPATKGMSADEVADQIVVSTHYLEHLRSILPDKCGQEGHKWDHPAGRLTEVCVREGLWIEHEHEADLTSWGRTTGHWAINPEHRDVFERKCLRCGTVERKDPIKLGVKSPWA